MLIIFHILFIQIIFPNKGSRASTTRPKIVPYSKIRINNLFRTNDKYTCHLRFSEFFIIPTSYFYCKIWFIYSERFCNSAKGTFLVRKMGDKSLKNKLLP